MQPILRTSLLLPFFALALNVALTGQTPAPAPIADAASIEAMGNELYTGSGSTGLILVVVHGNQTVFRSYGETAPESHQAPTQESVIRLCSLTKIFTTDLLTKLVADDTVKLDDPLQKFAPPGRVVPKRVRPITLLDLATHTSGLPRELGYPPPKTPHFTYPDFETRWRWLPNQHLRSVPGTSALYSNVAFDFLSDALQAAAHKQYAALLWERTLKPLHMWNTTYFPSAEQCGRLLVDSHGERACTVTEATAGSSGLYSTASDMTIWLKYLLGSDGPGATRQDAAAQAIYILPADLKKQHGLEHAGEPTGVGLGWIHILPTDSPSTIVQKTGGGAGFATYIAINHARDTAIFVAATDGRGSTHFNLYEAANNLLLAVAGLPPLPPPPAKPVIRHKRSVTRQGHSQHESGKHRPAQRRHHPPATGRAAPR